MWKMLRQYIEFLIAYLKLKILRIAVVMEIRLGEKIRKNGADYENINRGKIGVN